MRGTARNQRLYDSIQSKTSRRADASGFATRALSGVNRSGACVPGPAARTERTVAAPIRIRENMQNRANIVSKITDFFGKKCDTGA